MDTDHLLPSEIANLLDKELFFKVQVAPNQVSRFNGAYTVKDIKSDVDPTAVSVDADQVLCHLYMSVLVLQL